MGRNMAVQRVEELCVRGLTLSEAVRVELDQSLSSFGREIGRTGNEVSMMLNGYPGRVYPEVRRALAKKMGMPVSELSRLIEEYAPGAPE